MSDPIRSSYAEEIPSPPIRCGATQENACEDTRSSRSRDGSVDAMRLPGVRELLPGYCQVPVLLSRPLAFPSCAVSPTQMVPLVSVSVPPSARPLFSCFPYLLREQLSGVRRRRFPPAITQLLSDWLHTHSANPYPDDAQKRALCRQSGLSIIQLNYWLANYRRRHMTDYMKRKKCKNESLIP